MLALNTKAQSSLWAYGISGDLPILVVRINKAEDLPMVRKILRGHEYLHYKGLKIDLRNSQRPPDQLPASRCRRNWKRWSAPAVCKACRTNQAASFCDAPTSCPKPIAFCFTPWPEL